MNSLKKPVLAALALLFLSLTAGCVSNPQDSAMPWSRPADWQNQIPGLGNMGQ